MTTNFAEATKLTKLVWFTYLLKIGKPVF